MNYDPIKYSLGKVFNSTPVLRKIFYVLLDILLLRAWHIKKELYAWKKTASHNTHIIDAGAGFGQYVYFLSTLSNSWKITGIDVKTEQIEDCNNFFKQIDKSNRVSFIEGDLTTYNVSESANLIVCVDVMEHILEDEQVFRNFNATLASNGMLLISTPSDQGGSDVHDHHDESFVGEHVRDGYNIQDIQTKLSNAGFTNIQAYYSYGFWGSVSWKLSMKYPIQLINFSKIFFLVLPFYYCLVFPYCLLFNCIDVAFTNSTGTGLIVKAYKK